MKKILFVFAALAIAFACSSDKTAKVQFTISDAADSTEIIVSKLAINRVNVIDTIYVKNGKVSFQTPCYAGSPDFYYFMNNGSKIASLVLQAGDKISVKGTLAEGVSEVQGSEEAVKFAALDAQNDKANKEVSKLAQELNDAIVAKDAKKEKELTAQLSRMFIKYKQEATKYIYNNPTSITVIPVLYQRLASELPLFGEPNDVFVMKTIYESLSHAYPASPYVTSLADDIKVRESYLNLGAKIQSVQEMSYPNISLYDQNAKVRNLSELDGKVIVLSFWSTTEPTHKIFNAELKNIYDKYKSKGMEVYQVCVDADKTAWARQVKDQGLEWVSVCDPGNITRTLQLYNIQKLPALYIIDKEGNIVDRDMFDLAKLEKTIARLVK